MGFKVRCFFPIVTYAKKAFSYACVFPSAFSKEDYLCRKSKQCVGARHFDTLQVYIPHQLQK